MILFDWLTRFSWLYYLIFINLTAFLMIGFDKRKARARQWRISEKMLFIPALIGGALGGLIGMYFFRHKIRKIKFTLGFPAIFLIWLIAFYIFILN